MSEPAVLLERLGGILRITLNRPARRNAINIAMAEGLAAALGQLDDDPDLAVGLIEGAGAGFSAGVDLVAYEETGRVPAVEGRGFAGIADRSSRKPLIASVEGFALAGGFEIALACDLIVAANNAIVGLPEVRLGLIASGGGLHALTRRATLGVALEVALTGRPIGAVRAVGMGLVDRLAAPGKAFEESIALAQSIALGAPLALAAAKELLRDGWDLADADFKALQAELATPLLESEDAAEGVRGFNEKRSPRWSGR